MNRNGLPSAGRAARLSALGLDHRDDIRTGQLLQSADGNSARVENGHVTS